MAQVDRRNAVEDEKHSHGVDLGVDSRHAVEEERPHLAEAGEDTVELLADDFDTVEIEVGSGGAAAQPQPSAARPQPSQVRIDSPEKRTTDELIRLMYSELRNMAARLLRDESSVCALEPTALVNEAYLKLRAQKQNRFTTRSQFFYVGSRAMRQILVDHARHRKCQKRGGGVLPLPLNDDAAVVSPVATDILELNEAIEVLSRQDHRLSKIVEMRCFGGMTVAEVAEALGVSVSTVESDWRLIRRWLRKELAD